MLSTSPERFCVSASDRLTHLAGSLLHRIAHAHVVLVGILRHGKVFVVAPHLHLVRGHDLDQAVLVHDAQHRPFHLDDDGGSSRATVSARDPNRLTPP
jgi:hypothetical protein